MYALNNLDRKYFGNGFRITFFCCILDFIYVEKGKSAELLGR